MSERPAKIGHNFIMGEGCQIAPDVIVGHNTIIHDNVEIGDGSIIDYGVPVRRLLHGGGLREGLAH